MRFSSALTHLTFSATIALLTSISQAAPVTINFNASMSFTGMDSAFGSSTLGQAIDNTYGTGTGTSATSQMTGSMSYNSDIAEYQSITNGSQSIANYLSPITDISFNLWGQTFNADILGVANGKPGFIQTNVSGTTGCIGFTNCTGTPISNGAFVGDNVPTELTSNTGTTTYPQRDNFSVFFGGVTDPTGTDGLSAFIPLVLNTAEGELYIFMFNFVAVSNPNENLWSSAELPGDAKSFDQNHLEVMSIGLIMVGKENGTDNFVASFGNGEVSSYTVTAQPTGTENQVPEPTTALLLVAGFAALKTHSKKSARKTQ